MNFDIRYLRYRVRGRTAAEWAAINEVLLDRELGLETDTRKFKFGDGLTPWSDLAYAGGGEGAVSSVNGQVGDVELDAAAVGAATPAEVAEAIAALKSYVDSRPTGVYMPMVNGDVPPTLIHDDLGNLIYSQVE